MFSGRSLRDPVLTAVVFIHGVLLGFLVSVQLNQYWIEFVDLTPFVVIFTLYLLTSLFLRINKQSGNVLTDLIPLTFTAVFFGVQMTLSQNAGSSVQPLLDFGFICQIAFLGTTSFFVKRRNFTFLALLSSSLLILCNGYFQFAPVLIYIAILTHIAVFGLSIPTLKRIYIFPALNIVLSLLSLFYLRDFIEPNPATLLPLIGILGFQIIVTHLYEKRA